MQVLGKLLMQWVVLPLTRDLAIWLGKQLKNGISWVINYFQEKKRKKELKKVNTGKVEDYENATSKDEHSDTFGNLP